MRLCRHQVRRGLVLTFQKYNGFLIAAQLDQHIGQPGAIGRVFRALGKGVLIAGLSHHQVAGFEGQTAHMAGHDGPQLPQLCPGRGQNGVCH